MHALGPATLFWAIVNPPWVLINYATSQHLWWTFLGFSLISILLPCTLYFSGLRFVTSSHVIITSTAEPVTAVNTGAMMIHEPLSLTQLLGGILVLSAVAFHQKREPQGEC